MSLSVRVGIVFEFNAQLNRLALERQRKSQSEFKLLLGPIKRIVNSLVSRFFGHLIDESLICSGLVMVKHGDQQYQFGMGGGQFRQDQTDVGSVAGEFLQ